MHQTSPSFGPKGAKMQNPNFKYHIPGLKTLKLQNEHAKGIRLQVFRRR